MATISDSIGLNELKFSARLGFVFNTRPYANEIFFIECKRIGRLEPRKPGADRMITGRVNWEEIDCNDKGWDVHSKDMLIQSLNILMNSQIRNLCLFSFYFFLQRRRGLSKDTWFVKYFLRVICLVATKNIEEIIHRDDGRFHYLHKLVSLYWSMTSYFLLHLITFMSWERNRNCHHPRFVN